MVFDCHLALSDQVSRVPYWMSKIEVLKISNVHPMGPYLVPHPQDHSVYFPEIYNQSPLPPSEAIIRLHLQGCTSKVINIILLIASSSQSCIGTTISSGTVLIRCGGGGFSLPTDDSLADCSNVSDRGRGVEAGDETSGFCGDGEGAELASFANRFARTYPKSGTPFERDMYGIGVVSWSRHSPFSPPWSLRGR